MNVVFDEPADLVREFRGFHVKDSKLFRFLKDLVIGFTKIREKIAI